MKTLFANRNCAGHMPQKTLDSLDHRIILSLAENGSSSAGEIAARLGVTAPTVRARIKALEKARLLKIAGLIDPYQHQDLTTALIGLNIRSYGKLDQILEEVSQLGNVTWAAVVTGRYDIIAEVIIKGGMKELYQLTTDIIPKLGHVLSSETFVIMKSQDKWICLPKGLENW